MAIDDNELYVAYCPTDECECIRPVKWKYRYKTVCLICLYTKGILIDLRLIEKGPPDPEAVAIVRSGYMTWEEFKESGIGKVE